MAKVPDETKVYMANDDLHGGYLGFDHIIDVLKQDVAEGRIRPEQLSKVSMEQAVRRVADVWRGVGLVFPVDEVMECW